MRRILLVGSSRTEHNAILPRADEIWTTLSAAKKDKGLTQRADYVWDCHGNVNQTGSVTVKGIRKPLIDIRNPRLYRNELLEMRERTPGRYSNQFCYMLGLAHSLLEYENGGTVLMWRSQFIDKEYQGEVPMLMYWIGRLEAAHIPVICEPGNTLELPFDYGRST